MRDGRVLSRKRPSTPSSMKRSCQRQTQVLDLPRPPHDLDWCRARRRSAGRSAPARHASAGRCGRRRSPQGGGDQRRDRVIEIPCACAKLARRTPGESPRDSTVRFDPLANTRWTCPTGIYRRRRPWVLRSLSLITNRRIRTVSTPVDVGDRGMTIEGHLFAELRFKCSKV